MLWREIYELLESTPEILDEKVILETDDDIYIPIGFHGFDDCTNVSVEIEKVEW